MGLFTKISTQAEATAVSSLPVEPQLSVNRTDPSRAAKTVTNLGYTILRRRSTKTRQAYSLVWQNLTAADKTTLKKYYFTSELRVSKIQPGIYSVSAEIEELFLGS